MHHVGDFDLCINTGMKRTNKFEIQRLDFEMEKEIQKNEIIKQKKE